MNSKNKNIFIASLLALIALSGGYYFLNKHKELSSTSQSQNTINIHEPVGTISTTRSGITSYVNKNMGLTFEFPQDWHLGVNTLGDASGYGYLQLFNYDEKTADGKSIFPKGHNKIEASVTLNDKYTASSDYPAKSVNEQEIKVGAQKVSQIDVELLGGQKMRGYIIPLMGVDKKFLSVFIYGDPANFHVLDELVQSIEWTQ